MSIVVAVRKGPRIGLASDTQTSFGSSRIPIDNLRTQKVREVGRSLVAAAGWGLYENILEDFLARRRRAELDTRAAIFAFFMGFWKELHQHYSFVKDQADREDDSPFGNLDTSFLIVNRNGLFHVGPDMSVTVFEQYYAIGSGADFSLGALSVLYPSDAPVEDICRRAVEAAIAFDVHCGGEVDYRALDMTPPEPGSRPRRVP